MRIIALCVVAFVSLGSMFYSVAAEPVGKTTNIETDANMLMIKLRNNQQQIALAEKARIDLEASKQLALQQFRSVTKERETNQQLEGFKSRVLAEYALRKKSVQQKLAGLKKADEELVDQIMLSTPSEQDLHSMSDKQLRNVIATLCKSMKRLDRRIHVLEEANKARNMALKSK